MDILLIFVVFAVVEQNTDIKYTELKNAENKPKIVPSFPKKRSLVLFQFG